MKRFYLVMGFLFLSVGAHATSYDTYRATHTAVVNTTKLLCPKRTALFGGICINDVGGFAGSVTVFDSSGTANNAIAVIRSTSAIAAGCSYYNVQTSSGLTYTNDTAGTDITILYQCYGF